LHKKLKTLTVSHIEKRFLDGFCYLLKLFQCYFLKMYRFSICIFTLQKLDCYQKKSNGHNFYK
jgi:hypothetical protein